ncbi:MAG TPA: hypothetical protein PKO15_02565 [Fibrobacteria bacterium]|nr:hypothetical protein [Fibrobacteria bacterium]
MRRSLTLLLALQSLALANLGDWRLWTSVNSARNSVVRGQTVLTATGGGVVEWSAARTKQRLFTTLDGLPELNIVSVLSDDDGTIWAVGSRGRLGRLAPGASTWEPAGSYEASGWTFKTEATTHWKGFLILAGSKGLSLFSTSARVAMDNISSIKGKTVDFSSVLVINDTLWVATNKGTAYCVPDQAGWAKAGTPGHYLTDPARWHWMSEVPDQMLFSSPTTAVVLNQIPGFWADGVKILSADGQKFTWKGGGALIPGARHGIEAPGGGFIVASNYLGPIHVNADGTWKPMEIDGAFPFDPLPYSVSMDPNGNLYALAQRNLGLTALAKRPAGSYNWTLDTLRFQVPDSTGKPVTTFPWWDRGETKGRSRIGLDVEPDGRASVVSWISSDPSLSGVFLSRQSGKWSMVSSRTDTCLIGLINSGTTDLGTVLYGGRSRPNGLWFSQLEHDGIPSAQPFPIRVHHLPKGSDGPLRCWDIPSSSTEFQTTDLLPVGEDLWLATDKGIKRLEGLQRKPSGSVLATPSSPVGAGAGAFLRLERYPLGGKDWVLAAGQNILGLADPATDSFYAATSGTDQSYLSLAVDSKMQIWAAGNAGIDIFQASLQQDTNGTVAPVFEKVRRITRVDGLPENEIVDLRLDSASGRALISTESALILWASPFRPVSKKLEPAKVKIWPNPVRLSQNRVLFVDGVSEQADFSLIAQDGTLVYHLAKGKQTTGMFQLELPSSSDLRPGLYFWAVKDGNTIARGPLLIGY